MASQSPWNRSTRSSLPSRVTLALSGLQPQPPANTAPPADCSAELLALNRSDLDDAALRTAKHKLLAGPG